MFIRNFLVDNQCEKAQSITGNTPQAVWPRLYKKASWLSMNVWVNQIVSQQEVFLCDLNFRFLLEFLALASIKYEQGSERVSQMHPFLPQVAFDHHNIQVTRTRRKEDGRQK